MSTAARWAIACTLVACSKPAPRVTKEELGRRLFEDTALSVPPGQSCADCHVASAAFADAEDDRTSAGAVRGRFGIRNTPSILYARFIPPRHDDNGPIGGLFWDGRANSLEEQAALPLLNPLEMNNPSKAAVVATVRARHERAFVSVFGANAFADDDVAFTRVTEAIAAFERTPAFAPFSSKYDRYVAGREQLAAPEARGLALFEHHCTGCHAPPLFTTYRYVNLGLPRFNDNPFYLLPAPLNPDGTAYIDRGVGDGRFRIPSLRNVGRTTPYGHNGYYRRLDEMIAFHARTTAPPEMPESVDRSALAAFQPNERDIADLAAFLNTLTDPAADHAASALVTRPVTWTGVAIAREMMQ